MSRELFIYWLPYVVCIAVIVFSVYFMWKGLFADRPRGQRRCRKCWYDMAYTEGMTCSECGHVAQSESDFSQTRRHYGRAGISLTICVITFLAGYWKLTERGFIASLPTSVLIMSMPLVDDARSDLFRHISRRMTMNQITDSQRKKIIERCVTGDWMMAPPDDDWLAKYGTFLEPIRQRLPARRTGTALDPFELPLLDVPARVYFDTRKTWPKDSRARIRVRARHWWPVGYELKLRITPHDDPEDERTIIQRPIQNGSNAHIMYTDLLDETTTSVGYDVQVYRRRTEIGETEWVALNSETFILPITIGKNFESAIEAVETAETTEAMKRVFGNVTRWTGGPQPVRFNINYRPTTVEEFNGLGIGVRVELMHDGAVARTLELWWIAGQDVDYRGYDHAVPFEDVPMLLSINQLDLEEHWVLRVRSDPEIAYRAGDVAKYWKGEFTLDIGRLNMPQEKVDPKARNWWVEEGAEEESGEVAR